MDYVKDETGLAVADQDLHIVSKEMQLTDMSTWKPKRRKDLISALTGAVPDLLHNAYERFKKKTRETWKPAVVKPGDIAKYCEGHVYTWSDERLAEEVEKAGDWGGIDDPISGLLGDGENAFNITVAHENSYVEGGYTGSEFGTSNPPIPKATAKAFAAAVLTSVKEANAVVSSAFGHFVRLLKAQAMVPDLDKAEADKKGRAELLRRGEDGGYGATESNAGVVAQVEEVVSSANDNTTKSIVEFVMDHDHIKMHPTTRHTRVANFMEATRTDPATMSKNHVLIVRTSGEFLNRVTSIGEIIIRDHFKALCHRVFQPADIGGIAGVRFLHTPILQMPHAQLYVAPHAPLPRTPFCPKCSAPHAFTNSLRSFSPLSTLHNRVPSTLSTVSSSSSRIRRRALI
jgi:hypothetical protein